MPSESGGLKKVLLYRRDVHLKNEEMDKTELAKRIREIEGLTNEERSELLALLNSRKRYGLVWEDKPEEAEEILKTHIPVLTEVKDKGINHDTETQKNPNHILIEGDNLHALTSLCYTHEGKIDVIYIDPPYNTGNKDFVYNDSYVDTEDSYRHSKWLSFMNKRLRIAKRLLSENGIVFISIGDDEISNLSMLCKEIFGEKNYIETYIWTSTLRPDNSSPLLRRNAEFVICCCKDIRKIEYFNGVVSETSGMPSLTKAKEKIKTICFPPYTVKTNLKDGVYFAGMKENGRNPQWQLLEDVVVKNGLIISELRLRGHSYWATEKKIKEEIEAGTEIWIKSETFVPYYKKAKESINRPTKILPVDYVKDGLYANVELNDGLFNQKVFNNPKPSTLISFLINFVDKRNVTILDFFAGSGTTLHATMQLNAEDGGHRQCILVTNNENDICEKVTYERNKRVINGYTTPKGVAVEGLKANNLRYFKCEMKPRELSHQSKRELVMAMTDILRIKEDIYTEQNQFGSLPLHGKARLLRYFADGDRRMLMVYDTRVLPFVIKEIGQMEGTIKIYLFADGAYPYTEDFRSVMDKVELVALPHAFSQALKHVLPQAPEEALEEPNLTEEEQAAMMEEAI